MDSFLDDLIQPKGWLPWAGDFGLHTCFYAEFDNRGPGAVDASLRARWKGVKNLTAAHALDFTPGRFFKGDWWIRRTGVPYVAGKISAVEKKD